MLEDLDAVFQLPAPVRIKVADGSTLKATNAGATTLHFVSDQGEKCTLKLLRVLYVPGLSRRLFCVESFTSSSNRYQITFQGRQALLRLKEGCTFTIQLPQIPTSMLHAFQHFLNLELAIWQCNP